MPDVSRTFSWFRRGGDASVDVLVPLDLARSLWSTDQMHGVAVAGALARGLERAVAERGRTDLRPARVTVDLFRPASMDPCHTTTTIVREGPRLCLVDASLHQNDTIVARATAIFLRASEDPQGEVWSSGTVPAPPPLEIAEVSEDARVPIFGSDDAGWTMNFADHQNGSRKRTWQTAVSIVEGEPRSLFQSVVSVADATSMVTNWGSGGIQFINTDINLVLSRMPVSTEIGLEAIERVSNDGIAVGTAIVFDRDGVIGTSVVTSLTNAKRTVDLTTMEFEDGPRPSA